jgi:hypothetical protein
MANAQNDEGTLGLAPRVSLKEIYLSLFVLFFRINKGAWPEYVKADEHKGVAGITLLQGSLAIAASNFTQVLAGHQIVLDAGAAGLMVLPVYFLNSYFLVERGAGTAFEKEFSGFARKKQTTLYLVATAITLLIVAALVLSIAVYRSAFAISS